MRRYAQVDHAGLVYALTITLYLFSICVPVTTMFIHLAQLNKFNPAPQKVTKTSEAAQVPPDKAQQNESNSALRKDDKPAETVAEPPDNAFTRECSEFGFFQGPGLLIVFAATVISLYSLINTLILRHKFYRPVETLEELLVLITEKLEQKSDWQQYARRGNIFYYVFDHTIATGHVSARESEFDSYARILKAFLNSMDCNESDESGVCFRALISSKLKVLEYYDDIPRRRGMNIIEDIIEGNDAFAWYLNKNKLASPDQKTFHVRYEPYHDKEPIKKLRKLFLESGLEDIFINPAKQRAYTLTNADIQNKKDDAFRPNCEGLVVQTGNVGLTRFIVCNSFLVHFVAAIRDHSRAQPAGFFSEDVVLIERFRTVFEHYWRNECKKDERARKGIT